MNSGPDVRSQFVMITGASDDVASQLLADNLGDLSAAITSYYAIQDAGGAFGAVTTAPAAHQLDDDDDVDDVDNAAVIAAAMAADEAYARELADEAEREVRAPLPDRVEQLLPSAGGVIGGASRHARRAAQTVDDPFLRSDGTHHANHLASLFRPPTDLIASDDWDSAMAAGQKDEKWLLVNMQRSDNFQCHILNRDVWANPELRDLVQAHFVFWQRDEQTEDGARYKQFYPYEQAPHVAIVDPRSGERLIVWGGDGNTIDRDVLVRALTDFCGSHSLAADAPDRLSAVTSARNRTGRTRAGPSSATIDLDKDVMETEDAQIAAAIAASMESGGPIDIDDDFRDANGVAADEAPMMVDNGDDDDDIVSVPIAAANSASVLGPGTFAQAAATRRIQPETQPPVDVERHTSRLLSATDPSLNQDRSIRAQQDSEYEESLALDRAKVESEREESLRAQRSQRDEEERASLTEMRLAAKRARVAPPPPDHCGQPTTELMIRLPSGKRLQRRFLASNTIGDVYDFVDVESGNELGEDAYNLVVPFPRTNFFDRSMTLTDAQLSKKAVLVVNLL
jgi:UBX domain/Thioredoxin-like/UBA-like domain